MKNLTLPGNPRYQPKSLQDIFGYDNLYTPYVEVQLAALSVLGDIGVIPADEMRYLTPEKIRELLSSITTSEVDIIERQITKHDIRALTNLVKGKLGPPLDRWVHIPLTSYDVIDTGRVLQFKRGHAVIQTGIKKVISILAEKVKLYADTLQIGRTHGQHALPITFGFWLATILSRVIYNASKADTFVEGLKGKISGAVGAYNAQVGLGIEEKCGQSSFEERVLHKLQLKPALISTQILPPEATAYYLFSLVALSASLGQLGRDCRHLMRTEIGEVSEPFEKGQVGSSTMAHKRNPINFENFDGMASANKWEFGKVMETLISEHQRDLVGSSIMRSFPTIVVNLAYQLQTLLRKKDENSPEFLRNIHFDEEMAKRNFSLSSNFTLAEPIYIALQMAGYSGDAHKLVNEQAMPIAQQEIIQLFYAVESLAKEDPQLADALENIPVEFKSLFTRPERYIGKAKEKSMEVYEKAQRYLAQ